MCMPYTAQGEGYLYSAASSSTLYMCLVVRRLPQGRCPRSGQSPRCHRAAALGCCSSSSRWDCEIKIQAGAAVHCNCGKQYIDS